MLGEVSADGNKSYYPSVYRQEFMGTELSYKYNSYKIIGQSEEALRADPNPFAVAALTALMAIQYRDSNDEQWKDSKLDLYNEMMKRKMEKSVRQGIYDYSLTFTFMMLMSSPCSVSCRTMCSLKIRICCVSLKKKYNKTKEGVPPWEPENIFWKKQKTKAKSKKLLPLPLK